MQDTMTRFMAEITDARSRNSLRRVLRHVVDRFSTQPLRTAGLVIKAGGGVLTKIGAADYYASVQGTTVTIAAATDMPALTGLTIAANTFNTAHFYVDIASVVTLATGTQGATLGTMVHPEPPFGKALVGLLIITHSATFTGNTTALDTATTVYISPVGPWDPTMLV